MALYLILLLPFVGALGAALLRANARNLEAWLAAAIAIACASLLATKYPDVADGRVVRVAVDWLPQFGLTFGLRLDGFSWMFAMMVTVIGALVVVYARYYMSPADPVPRFFAFLLAFMGSMLGVVLSGNLIQLVVFWELTSFTSFVLIAYWYHRPDARAGARMALTVTAAGGTCLLAAVLMLGHIAGGYELDEVVAATQTIHEHALYPAIIVLVLLAAFTKSAQFPFHFWLPRAMAAPTPVSAYLHSATMVKAGVFLLARLWPVLSGGDLWFAIVCSAGLASLLLGAYAATFQRDMKGVLAYSTISHLGLITLLLGMNSPLALVAAVFHMFNHATFKASLFMAAGIVDHETGTRDLQRLGGLYQAMPITATLAMVAAAAMAGVPLLNGFLSKEMFFAETIFAGEALWVRIALPATATVAGMFSVAYSARFIRQVFFGSPGEMPREPHEPTRLMLLPSATLVLLCLLVGTLPGRTVGPMLDHATRSILGAERMPTYSLAVWHGLNTPLLMSAAAFIGGLTIYFWLTRKGHPIGALTPVFRRFDGKRAFHVSHISLVRAATLVVRTISSTRLQTQLALIVVSVISAATVATVGRLQFDLRGGWTRIDVAFALMWLVGSACAIGAALQAKFHRLAALIMVGCAGLVTSLTFAWFSAPDLALTQVSVEVVTTVLLLLGLRWMPKRLPLELQNRNRPRARARRVRDATLAILAGAGLATLAYAVLMRPAGPGIKDFIVANALPGGGGQNIVNVILVDFRGFDTFGEITVLGIVALTIYKLLRRFRPAPEVMTTSSEKRDGAREPSDPSAALPTGAMLAPAVLGRLVLPMAGVVSVYFLLRGHNEPGGGFVGGLVMATGFIVQYLVNGTLWVESRMRIHPLYWIGGGLLCAAGAGMLAWFAAQPFLSALEWEPSLPVLGKLHLSTVLIFDLGVYMLVVGTTTLMLIALAHQSLRSYRRMAEAEQMTSIRMVR
ncbi:monovalent cation/H+ antiporter subunit A [Steroidobacter sp. S1-65]|uniref:Monovalent cation/H+ antiporter subunit A n=1 Tax=Steroidobacter gossypii TaxID=2805490 RepID=A0ABS1X1D4_9GAMM|nr:monovalent cation/H+ antiporter subunit A [Steroidobacter gossypii]MBM0107048.1 monovalent cation/H+ antiporter subunit A [Steroidobacter gossypii]